MKAILFIAALFFIIQNNYAQTNNKDSVESNTVIHLCAPSRASFANDPLPLLVVDGKEKAYSYMQSLDKDLILSVNVLKGNKALKKYGKKATNGVVIVTTKRDLILQP